MREEPGSAAPIRKVERFEGEPRILHQDRQARLLDGGIVVVVQVINPDDAVARGEQALRHVKADETRGAGHQNGLRHTRLLIESPGAVKR